MTSHRSIHTEEPSRDDIRLLGRLLVGIIDQQEGRHTFDILEQIRPLSVAFRRDTYRGAQERLTGCSIT